MENQAEETRIPTLTKKQMNAVINELTVHKNMLEAANRELARRASAGYETDSLERNRINPGNKLGAWKQNFQQLATSALECFESKINFRQIVIFQATPLHLTTRRFPPPKPVPASARPCQSKKRSRCKTPSSTPKPAT